MPNVRNPMLINTQAKSTTSASSPVTPAFATSPCMTRKPDACSNPPATQSIPHTSIKMLFISSHVGQHQQGQNGAKPGEDTAGDRRVDSRKFFLAHQPPGLVIAQCAHHPAAIHIDCQDEIRYGQDASYLHMALLPCAAPRARLRWSSLISLGRFAGGFYSS